MKTMVRNPIMIMPMATSVTVICRNQKLIAMMATNNAIKKIDLFYSAASNKWCHRK